MRWFRSEIVEQALNRHQVQYNFETIEFKKIDLIRSRRNNARFGEAINEDVMLAYAESMSDPSAAFPAPVVYKEARHYIIIDGNHRLGAFDASDCPDKGSIDAYVVSCDDPAILEILTRFFNRTNGYSQDTSEAVQHCVTLLGKYPTLKQSELAKQFGVHIKTLNLAVLAHRTRETLNRNKVKTNGTAQGVLAALSPLSHFDEVLCKAGELVVSRNMNISATKELVGKVRECRSEQKMLDVIHQEAAFRNGQDVKPTVVQGKRLKNRDTLIRSLRTLGNFLGKNPSKEHLELTSLSDFSEAKGLAGDVIERLQRVFA